MGNAEKMKKVDLELVFRLIFPLLLSVLGLGGYNFARFGHHIDGGWRVDWEPCQFYSRCRILRDPQSDFV